MPGLRKAELIDGVVHMPPISLGGHAEPHFSLAGWLLVYKAATKGVRGGDNASVRLDMSSEPQPDLCLFIDPRCGGQARIDADDYLSGGPELVAEIARSSIHRDLGSRMAMYQRNDVREYLVWRIEAQAIDWFVLRDGQFVRLTPDASGILKSEVFPGLWLDAAAAVADDLPRLLAVLQQGIATPEHAAFVAQLSAAGGSPSSP
jgi:putative restriction endonuclease